MHEAFEEIGAPAFDETDHDYADRLAAAALTDSDRRASAEAFGAELEYPRNLHEGILALPTEPGLFFGSTDVGDVSNVVPVAQCLTATTVIGTPFHTWQTVTQGKMPHAHKAMVTAAKVMASTAARVVRDSDLRNAAQAEFRQRRGGEAYRSPIIGVFLALAFPLISVSMVLAL